MRTVRRTSRTACFRAPISAAIRGEAAPTRPVRLQIRRPNSETDVAMTGSYETKVDCGVVPVTAIAIPSVRIVTVR